MAANQITLSHRTAALTAVAFSPNRDVYSRVLNSITSVSGENQPGVAIITARLGKPYFFWTLFAYVPILSLQLASILISDQDQEYSDDDDGHILLTDECRYSEAALAPHPQTLVSGSEVTIGAYEYGFPICKVFIARGDRYGELVGTPQGDRYILDITARELPD